MLILLTHGYSFPHQGNAEDPRTQNRSNIPASIKSIEKLEKMLSNSDYDGVMNLVQTNNCDTALRHYHLGLTFILKKRYNDAQREFRQAISEVGLTLPTSATGESLNQESFSHILNKALYTIELASVYMLKGEYEISLKLNYGELRQLYPKSNRSLITALGMKRYCEIDLVDIDLVQVESGIFSPGIGASGYAVTDDEEGLSFFKLSKSLSYTADSKPTLYNEQMKILKYKRLELICRALNNIAASYCEIGKLNTAKATLEEVDAILNSSNKLVVHQQKTKKNKRDSLRIQKAIIACNTG